MRQSAAKQKITGGEKKVSAALQKADHKASMECDENKKMLETSIEQF